MNEYINTDFLKAIKSCVLKKGVSKDGADYLYLDLGFTNGYKKRVFINSEAEFAIRNAYETMVKANKSRDDFKRDLEEDTDSLF